MLKQGQQWVKLDSHIYFTVRPTFIHQIARCTKNAPKSEAWGLHGIHASAILPPKVTKNVFQMKIFLSKFLFLLFLLVGPVQRAQATIGAIVGAPAVVTVAGFTAGSSAAISFAFLEYGKRSGPERFFGWFRASMIMAGVALIGLAILEEDQSFKYTQLSLDQAPKLDLLPSQTIVFN